jgi:hypothetical protein
VNKIHGFSRYRRIMFAACSAHYCRTHFLRMEKISINPSLVWWAHKGSNLGPLPCEGNALPLSYAPGMSAHGLRRKPRIAMQSVRAGIYEARAAGVKRSRASKTDFITPPAGGRGRHATATPGCVRRAFRLGRRRREGPDRWPRRRWRPAWPTWLRA